MNVRVPGQLKAALQHLDEAAKILNRLDAEDWATDIEQTRHAIETDFQKEYDEVFNKKT